MPTPSVRVRGGAPRQQHSQWMVKLAIIGTTKPSSCPVLGDIRELFTWGYLLHLLVAVIDTAYDVTRIGRFARGEISEQDVFGGSSHVRPC